MQLKIRLMTRRDKPAIMQILKTAPEFQPAEVTIAEELIDYYLENPSSLDYRIYVARVESRTVGYICYGPTPLTEGTWDIYWMAVAGDFQGQGIGKAMLAFAENKIREAHGRLSFIETSSQPHYEKTRRFHYSQGYELISRIPDFYSPGDDKLTLWKRL
ncbi:MAG: GNAT family N-acetyltransferase [Chloroflexota bacterium]